MSGTQTTNNQPTEVEQLRQQVSQLQVQLAESQKLSCLGELVGTTTHEFNYVLMTVINYARMGLRHQDDPTRTKAFEKILAASNRANQITNSVLGMAGNRSERFETTCLKQLVEQTMILMEREFQKYRVSVEYNMSEAPPVWANGNQIQQVFLNFLINARQAMSDGGRLLIGLNADEASQQVALSVRDFGTGIPQEKLPKIFDAGFSTKDGPDESGKGGTGLGLYTCRNIIDAHKGRIRVESTVGQGTCFTIKLPMAKTSQPSLQPKIGNLTKTPVATN